MASSFAYRHHGATYFLSTIVCYSPIERNGFGNLRISRIHIGTGKKTKPQTTPERKQFLCFEIKGRKNPDGIRGKLLSKLY